jgi:hypothetical protein
MWMLGVYFVGVVVGLVATQGGAGTRLLLALLWPLGPLAFVITVTDCSWLPRSPFRCSA